MENRKAKNTANLLSEKAVSIWRIRVTLILVLFSFLIGGLYVFWRIFATVLGIIGLIAYFIIILVYCPSLYKVCGYSINENTVIIDKGYFIHHSTQIHSSKVQYCIISQGPLQKLYGICSIMLLTAGSSEIINDISVINAQKIKNSLEE